MWRASSALRATTKKIIIIINEDEVNVVVDSSWLRLCSGSIRSDKKIQIVQRFYNTHHVRAVFRFSLFTTIRILQTTASFLFSSSIFLFPFGCIDFCNQWSPTTFQFSYGFYDCFAYFFSTLRRAFSYSTISNCGHFGHAKLLSVKLNISQNTIN